jgi:hypothetical protein
MVNDKQIKEKKIIVRVSLNTHSEFINHCNNNGYSISKRLRLLIDKDINKQLIIK